jgi:hypothetical protein
MLRKPSEILNSNPATLSKWSPTLKKNYQIPSGTIDISLLQNTSSSPIHRDKLSETWKVFAKNWQARTTNFLCSESAIPTTKTKSADCREK